MCMSKTKVVPASAQPAKPIVYMRNPYLDGLGMSGEARGRNSLRIDMGTPAAHAPTPAPLTPWTPPVSMSSPTPTRGSRTGTRTDLTMGSVRTPARTGPLVP